MTAAQILAGAIIDCLTHPSLVAAAKRSFERELDGVRYEPLLPLGQKPKLDTHTALMERYRPKMRDHYLTRRPVFRRP